MCIIVEQWRTIYTSSVCWLKEGLLGIYRPNMFTVAEYYTHTNTLCTLVLLLTVYHVLSTI